MSLKALENLLYILKTENVSPEKPDHIFMLPISIINRLKLKYFELFKE